MGRRGSLLSSAGCGRCVGSRPRRDSLLPLADEKTHKQRTPPLRASLGHGLWRRIIICGVVSLVLLNYAVSHRRHAWMPGVAEQAQGQGQGNVSGSGADPGSGSGGGDDDDDGGGTDEEGRPTQPLPMINTFKMPRPKPYNPYTTNKDSLTPCYLDKGNRIPAPDVLAYKNLPPGMLDASIGSHEVVGIRDDVCFDRFGRYGPYGFGYAESDGGVGIGQDMQDAHSNSVWARTGKINYQLVDWGDAQDRCVAANQHRLARPPEPGGPRTTTTTTTASSSSSSSHSRGGTPRQAVILRCYTSYEWTPLAVVNLRAMVSELSLKSGGEYSVHILLHVLDNDRAIWADETVVQDILDQRVPPEFHGLVTMWNEAQMKLFYPGEFRLEASNPSQRDVRGVYRAAHLPLQIFAWQHPEYEYLWNWEMDMRHLGNYYELFDRIGRFAEQQPRKFMWERNERYYIPSYHGSWDNFSQTVEQNHMDSGRDNIFGPVDFPGRKPLRAEQRGVSPLPDNCHPVQRRRRQQQQQDQDQDQDQKNNNNSDEMTHDNVNPRCGVGEPADLITFDPMFDVTWSSWVFSNDVTGYTDVTVDNPPRRSSVVTASRLSRRLLHAMHEDVWRYRRTMFCEMFPATVVLHRGYKSVYAPHPMALESEHADAQSLDRAFNSGRDHSTSGSHSPFSVFNEHVHKESTFYYHSEFAGRLWRRWLGFTARDELRRRSEDLDEEAGRGGHPEARRDGSHDRLCLRSMLFHPIKWEAPDEL